MSRGGVRDDMRSGGLMRPPHEVADTLGEYIMTIPRSRELLRAVADSIRLSAAGCSRRQPAMSRNRTRAARPAARPTARLLPDPKPAIL